MSSKVGHILTELRSNFRNPDGYFRHYTIIGEYTNVWGEIEYYVDEWNSSTRSFNRYKANSSFFHAISEAPHTMTEKQEAMSRAIIYRRLASYCETIRRYYAMPYTIATKKAIGNNTITGTRFTLQDEYEFAMEDAYAGMAERAKNKRNRYMELYEAELAKSGVLVPKSTDNRNIASLANDSDYHTFLDTLDKAAKA